VLIILTFVEKALFIFSLTLGTILFSVYSYSPGPGWWFSCSATVLSFVE